MTKAPALGSMPSVSNGVRRPASSLPPSSSALEEVGRRIALQPHPPSEAASSGASLVASAVAAHAREAASSTATRNTPNSSGIVHRSTCMSATLTPLSASSHHLDAYQIINTSSAINGASIQRGTGVGLCSAGWAHVQLRRLRRLTCQRIPNTDCTSLHTGHLLSIPN